ncbi:MAG: MBL fold metallo-hydrolase, partial [Methylocella sp.]
GNAGPMTFTGTCTYVLGTGAVAVIDPGPDRPDHIAALLAALRGQTITMIVVTHTHKDHSPGARALKAATGARIVGCAPYNFPRRPIGKAVDAANDFAYPPDVACATAMRSKGKISRSSVSRRPATRQTIEPSPCRKKALCFRAIMSWPGRVLSSRLRMARCAITWLRSTNSWLATTKVIGRGMAGRSSSRDVLCTR